MRLFLDIGHCDRLAKRGALSGRTIAVVSDTVTGSDHGALLACAEGVAQRGDGEQAAKTAATSLADAYSMAMDTDAPQRALEEAFDAANLAVRSGGERGRAAVIGAVVLRGRRALIGHAGNVRVWRCRDQQIKQLTRDHLAPRALQQTEVTRACGLSDDIDAECAEEPLKEGDVFLITSPGAHQVLQGSAILGVLQSDYTAQQMADLLAQRAIDARAGGYVGTCVARVEKLPPHTASASHGATLPVVAPPAPGEKIDGFVIEKLVLKNRRFRLYRAEDRESGETVALRFPARTDAADGFLREERIGRRIESPFILRPIALRPGQRTALYSVVEHRRAENLERRIRRKHGLPVPQALLLGEQLLAALETLHTHGIVHRDLGAHNLFYDKFTRQLWMLALGIDRADVASHDGDKPPSKTLSYCAPELLRGGIPSESSNIYAAGVTIYRMLTAEYPYGKIGSPDEWKEARIYASLRRRDGTLWGEIDDVLARACAVDPRARYANVAQFAAALGAARAKAAPTEVPTYARTDPGGPSAAWSWWLAAALAAGLITYLYFVLR